MITNNTNDTIKSETIAEMAKIGYDKWYFSDVAFCVSEGCDYDEQCQKATDAIAEDFGIPTLAEDENAYENDNYCLINRIVNDMVTAELADLIADKDNEDENEED